MVDFIYGMVFFDIGQMKKIKLQQLSINKTAKKSPFPPFLFIEFRIDYLFNFLIRFRFLRFCIFSLMV